MNRRIYGVKLRRSIPLRLSAHPHTPASDEWYDWMRRSSHPIAIDLFCGAGGLSYGLASAGYRIALSVDTNRLALETHAHNIPGRAISMDLHYRQARDELVKLFEDVDVDLIAGGPPCQPFSTAGRSKIRDLIENGIRDSNDNRRELWRAFLDVVERIRPRAVLLENVPGMALGEEMIVLRTMLGQLDRCGYDTDARIVDSWLHGVPQQRQRLILVGVRDGSFVWPQAVQKVNLRESIGDLPELNIKPDCPIGAEVMVYNDVACSDFVRRARRYCTDEDAKRIYDHVTRPVRADDLEIFKLMSSGTLYSELPDSMKRYRDDIFCDKYNRLDWANICRSITAHLAKDGYWYIHPEQHRTLTVREAARIQTFPDNYRFAGSRSHQFEQIGNAVPPALAEKIGSALIKSIYPQKMTNQCSQSAKRLKIRKCLREWADEDRKSVPWSYPGDPWPVAVGLIVGSRAMSDQFTPKDILRMAPTFEDVTPQLFTKIHKMTCQESYLKAIQKLESIVNGVKENYKELRARAWHIREQLGPAARDWYNLLTGDSVAPVASTAVLRVTARVTGSGVDTRYRNSKGRMELAKLIGYGPDAAILNAAMHRLGQQTCTLRNPVCHTCPLHSLCKGAIV